MRMRMLCMRMLCMCMWCMPTHVRMHVHACAHACIVHRASCIVHRASCASCIAHVGHLRDGRIKVAAIEHSRCHPVALAVKSGRRRRPPVRLPTAAKKDARALERRGGVRAHLVALRPRDERADVGRAAGACVCTHACMHAYRPREPMSIALRGRMYACMHVDREGQSPAARTGRVGGRRLAGSPAQRRLRRSARRSRRVSPVRGCARRRGISAPN